MGGIGRTGHSSKLAYPSGMATARSPRMLRVLKWAGTAVCGLLLATWFASRWFRPELSISNGVRTVDILVTMGQASVIQFAPVHDHGWSISADFETNGEAGFRPAWYWGFDWGGRGFVRAKIRSVPLWLPCLSIAIPTACLWLLFPERRFGLCVHCGYDRAGLRSEHDACPECGRIPESNKHGS
jgi:hypothetical protein